MKLTKIRLKNFKGIKSKEVEAPNGCSLNIFGKNASGKTTLADAITYVLFDKDTAGRSPNNFGIKTVDDKGDVIHNLEHEVEATFIEPDVTLRKVYQEKWTRSRGSSSEDLSGHTTDYYVDDEPVKKKDYESRIAEIMSEEQFKILTVPNYFAEQIHWSQRRKMLSKMAGDIDEDEIISSDEELSDYKDILDGKTAESRKKILTEQRKKYLDRIDNIPDRIDENVMAMVDVDVSSVDGDIEKLNNQKSELEEQLSKARSGGGVSDLQVKIEEIETQKQKLISNHNNTFDESLEKKRKELNEATDAMDEQYESVTKAKEAVREATDQVGQHELSIDDIKSNLAEVESQEPKSPPSEVESEGDCPYCGQSIPESDSEHDAQAEYDEYLKEFNEGKAESIKSFMSDLESAEKEYSKADKELAKLEKVLDKERKKHEKLSDKASYVRGELNKMKSEIPDVKQTEEYKSLQLKQDALDKKVADIRSNNKAHIDDLQGKLSEVASKISEHEEQKFEVKKNAERQARIEELKAELKKARESLEDAEHGLYVIQRFDVAQAEVITDKVNKMFGIVRWKMFEPQINGGVNDQMCEPMVGGVPYGNGLNNAMRIQAGLDIINTLGTHYGKEAPVVVDNAEAINDMNTYDLQVIALYVSTDKELKVEVVK